MQRPRLGGRVKPLVHVLSLVLSQFVGFRAERRLERGLYARRRQSGTREAFKQVAVGDLGRELFRLGGNLRFILDFFKCKSREFFLFFFNELFAAFVPKRDFFIKLFERTRSSRRLAAGRLSCTGGAFLSFQRVAELLPRLNDFVKSLVQRRQVSRVLARTYEVPRSSVNVGLRL